MRVLWYFAGAALIACCGRLAADESGQAQLDFANGLFHRGFFPEAAEEFERYLKDYPDGGEKATVLYRLAESAYAVGQHEKALTAFTQALELPIDDAVRRQAELGRGETLFFLKRPEEAEAALTPLSGAEQAPEIRMRALYYLGKAQHARGNLDGALTTLRTLTESSPDSTLTPYARYQIAFALIDRNDLESAALEFSAVANSNADAALRMECRYRAAETYDKLKWYNAAVGAYEQLRHEFPESDYARRAEYGYIWALYHEGKFAEAILAVEAFVAANPDTPYLIGLKYIQANCLQDQAKYDDAIAIYSLIREQKGAGDFAVRAQFKSAWAHYLKGDTATAKREVTDFLQKQKDSPLVGDSAFLMGMILVAEGNYEDAYQEFHLVAEKYPNGEFGAESLFKAAECLAQMGLTDQAAQRFESFVKKYPDNPLVEQAMRRAGDALFRAADFEDAVAKYKAILERPADATAEQDTLYRLAITYHNMKNFSASAEAFRQMLEKHPDTKHKAEALFRIAEHQLRDQRDAIHAIESYQAALDAEPEGEFAGVSLRGLALARYEKKDMDAAADLFRRVIQEHPSIALNEETYLWLGQFFYDKGVWDAAENVLETFLERVPGYPYPEQVRFLIAECGEKSGNAQEALKRYAAVIDLAPASTKALEAKYRMARIHESLNEREKALTLYEAAANSNTGDVAARARFRLGELFEEQGEFDKAARSYMRVAILFLHPELSPDALWRAGQCFEKTSNAEQARKAYDELIADYPDHAHAASAREALEKMGQG